MWHTSEGDRVLKGKERSVFLHGLYYLLSDLECDLDGHEIIGGDAEKIRQQVVGLAQVTRALLDTNAPAPEICCWNEKTVYDIFLALRDAVHEEIEHEARVGNRANSRFFRTPILAAYKEFFDGLVFSEAEDWDFSIEALADRILWDRDFEFDASLLSQSLVSVTDFAQSLAYLQDIVSKIDKKFLMAEFC